MLANEMITGIRKINEYRVEEKCRALKIWNDLHTKISNSSKSKLNLEATEEDRFIFNSND